MPEISRFYGIVIKMYFGDHQPPHFHAEYGQYEVIVAIDTLAVIAGKLPPPGDGAGERVGIVASRGTVGSLAEGA